jgi:hypothetical protein
MSVPVSCAPTLARQFSSKLLIYIRQFLSFGALSAVLAPALVAATVADLPRSNSAIEIDGILGEGEWADAVQIELDIETNPAENGPAAVKTTVYLVEDGRNLLVAFDARDPDPTSIRAYLRDRDSAWEDDHVGIVLDTYNDERRAFQFFANPLGVQMDKTHNDVGGGNGNDFDASWDAIWDSAGKINDLGYVVEMRIPLSQLRFPDVAGPKTWGYDLLRVYPRDRTYRLSNHPNDRNLSCYLCQVGKLQGLEGSQPSRDIEIVPTITASQASTTEDPAETPIVSGNPDVEAGLTVRWGITPDLTANLAINPDFSQIESDVLQLDVNNRFALFFPEKRPFFLEGADYYDTPIDAVFTRTVADPDLGAKLTGKRGDHTFGVFAALDAETNLLFPGLFESDSETLEQENTAVVGRYSYGFADTSSLGVLLTARDGDNYRNVLGGFDGRWKINDQHRIEFQHLQTETEYPDAVATEFEQPQGAFSGEATLLNYNYGSRSWFGGATFEDYSSGFRADSGFVSQVGGESYRARFGHLWYGTDKNWWTRIRASVHGERAVAEDGRVLENEKVLRLGLGGNLQTWFQLALVDKAELWEGVTYDLKEVRAYFEIQPVGGLSLSVLGTYGDEVDYSNDRLGKATRVEPYVVWNITRKLLLRLNGVSSKLDTPDGETIFDATIIDARLTWQFSLRSFLRLTLQNTDIERNQAQYIEDIDSDSQDLGRQLLYSYKINPQTVFFLGYTDQLIDDDSLEDLTATDRTWFLKIGYAWAP